MAVRDETVASVYATALLDLAFAKGVHGEVREQLVEFTQLVARDERFRDFLNAPSISPAAKKDVLQRVFGGELSDHVLNFLKVVLDKRRQQALPEMVKRYVAGYHERMGELVVEVTSAVELGGRQRERLKGALKAKFNKDVILDERIKKALLGGLVLRIRDQRVDASLRSRLSAIEGRLHKTRLHGEDYYED